jgi:hypothetical protein
MKSPQTTPAPQVDPSAPAPLTAEQTAQVAGGLLTVRGGCCNTCASVGRPTFSLLAASLT